MSINTIDITHDSYSVIVRLYRPVLFSLVEGRTAAIELSPFEIATIDVTLEKVDVSARQQFNEHLNRDTGQYQIHMRDHTPPNANAPRVIDNIMFRITASGGQIRSELIETNIRPRESFATQPIAADTAVKESHSDTTVKELLNFIDRLNNSGLLTFDESVDSLSEFIAAVDTFLDLYEETRGAAQ